MDFTSKIRNFLNSASNTAGNYFKKTIQPEVQQLPQQASTFGKTLLGGVGNFINTAPSTVGQFGSENFIQPTVKSTYQAAKPILDYLDPRGYSNNDTGKLIGAAKAAPLTALNIYGLSRMKPAATAINYGIGGLIGMATGDKSQSLGQRFLQGGRKGLEVAPTLASIGSFTNPLIEQGASALSSGFTNPLIQQTISRGSTGLMNIPEGMLMKKSMTNDPYNLKDAAFDFGIGVLAGGSKPKLRVKGIDKGAVFENPQAKRIGQLAIKFDREGNLSIDEIDEVYKIASEKLDIPRKQLNKMNASQVLSELQGLFTKNQDYAYTNLPRNQGMTMGLMGGSQAKGYDQASNKFSSLADKKPRFEIDDSVAVFKVSGIQKAKEGAKLPDLIDHPALFKQYPYLKDLDVEFKGNPYASVLEQGQKGSFDGKKIVLNNVADSKEAKSTLLHEIQHAIQEKEGFATGGSPIRFEGDSREQAILKNIDYQKKLNTYNPTNPFSNKTSIPTSDKEYREMAEKFVDSPAGRMQTYQRLSGEVEARDVQSRMNLTPDQRVHTQPYASQGIPLKDQIVNFDNGVSNSNDFTKPLTKHSGDVLKDTEHMIKYNAALQLDRSPEIPKNIKDIIYSTDVSQAKNPSEMIQMIKKSIPTDLQDNKALQSTLDNWGKSAQMVFDSKSNKNISDEFINLTNGAKKYNNLEDFVKANKSIKQSKRIDQLVESFANGEKEQDKITEMLSGRFREDDPKLFDALNKKYDEISVANKSVVEQLSKEANLDVNTTIQGLSDYIDIGKRTGNRSLTNFYKYIERPENQLVDLYNQTKRNENFSLRRSVPKGSFTNIPEVDNPLLNKSSEDPFIKGLQDDQGKPFKEVPELPKPNKPIQKDFIDEMETIKKGANIDKKVNIVDYFRTPDRVLEKIGLKKEAYGIRMAYENYRNDLKGEISRVSEWQKQAPSPESAQKIFQFLDGKPVTLAPNEQKVANEIQPYLEQWADKLGLPNDKRIANYITHIFDFDAAQKEFDPEIAKLIQDRIPGSVYDPFLEKRLGKLGYKENVWQALDAYIKRATRKVNMDPALQALSNAGSGFEPETFNYIKRYADRINLRPTETDNLIDNAIKQSPIGYKYGSRPVTVLSQRIRQTVGRATLGLNIGSAVKNLSQGVNTYAKLGEKYTVIGYTKLIGKMASNDLKELYDVGVLDDSVIQDRQLNVMKSFTQKMDTALFSMFDMAEKINRGSAYFGAKSKAISEGLNEEQAIEYAKKIVRDTQFTFGSVDTPVALSSDIVKTLAQFQTYSLKQAEFLGGMIKEKDLAGLTRYIGASLVLYGTVGKALGWRIQDIIPSFRLDSPAIQQVQNVSTILNPNSTPNAKKKAVLKQLKLTVPAGTQIGKTLEGTQAVNQGYSSNATGAFQYGINQTSSNLLKAATFGKNSLSETRAYYDKKTPVPVTKMGMEMGFNPFESFFKPREKTPYQIEQEQKLQDKMAKSELKSSGDPYVEKNGKVYIRTKSGDAKIIEIDKTIEPPKLTGVSDVDKELIKDYKTSITTQVSDIVELYKIGKLSADEASKKIQALHGQSGLYNKGKKPKLSGFKVTMPKVSKGFRFTVKQQKVKVPKLPELKSNLKALSFRGKPLKLKKL